MSLASETEQGTGGAVRLHDGGDGHVNVKAEDGSYIGAYSGAAAVNWQQGKAAQVTKRGKDTVLDSASGGTGEQTQVTTPAAPTTQKTVVKNKDGSVTTYDGGHATAAISGAIALNIDDQAVTSELSGVTITDAARVQNIAQKDGALVAAGLGLAATKKNNEGQSAFDATGVAIDASLASNNAKNELGATISNATLTAGSVDNAAYDADDIAKPFDQAIEDNSVNATGSTYLENATDNAATNGRDASTTGDMTDRDYDIDLAKNSSGSTKQITAALSVSAATESGGVAGAGAAAIGTLQNTMDAVINTSTIDAKRVASQAKSDAVAVDVAAGVSVTGGTLSGAGSVAAQYTSDKTRAFLNNSEVTADDVTVTADSGNVDVTVAGQAGFGQNGLGLAVAFHHLGNTTGAYLVGSDVTAKTADGVAVTVTGTNHDTVVSVGAGVTGGETAAVNGSIAINQGNDDAEAIIDATTDKATGTKRRTNIKKARKLLAKAEDSSTKVAVAGAINGAGVAVNYDNTDSTAHVAGGTIAAKNVRVDATSKDKILNVGLGGTGAAYAGVTGSLGVNILGGHTRAAISDTALTGKTAGGATITSDGNVIVAAQRDGSIDNLAGVAAGSGLGASVGASVGGNVIATEVTADIDGAATSVTAMGGTAETVSDRIADDAFLDGYPEGKSGALLPATYMERKDSSYQGVAVTASSTNELNDRTLNLGLNGVGASVNGNVAVNTLSGKTAANVSAGSVKANGADGTGAGDLHVVAHDYANSSAYTGAVAVSGVGGSVGVGTTTTVVSRTTSATMTGADGATAQANRIAIDADAETALANLTATGAYTIAGLVGANVDNVTILSGKTEAAATGYDFMIGDSLDITARHGTNAYTLGALGAASLVSAGLGIDVMQDSSTTTAELTDGSVTTKENGTGDVTVAAENATKDNYKMITESAGYFGASTNVSAGNFNAQTTAHVTDMAIGDADRRAGAVDIHAKNTTQVTSDTWDGAVAGVGIGAGIQIATIGSDTDARVENSTVYASTIGIAADDEKNGTFRLGNTLAGGLAGGVNVGVLTAGHKVENTYSITGGDGTAHDSGADLTAVFSADGDVNTALKNSTLTESMTKGTGLAGPSVQTNNGADEHGEADAATTTASVTGGTLDATGDVTVTSNAAVNVKEENIYAAASLASFSGQVGVLDDAKQATVNVTDANIRGKNIALGTQLGGTSALDSYQGALGGIDVSGAFAFARSANSQGITLVGSTVTAGENVTVKTADDSTLKVHAYAVQPSLDVSASFQLAEADVVGATGITLGAGNAITAGKTIDIEAKSAPTIETDVKNTNDSLVFTGGVSVSTTVANNTANVVNVTNTTATANGAADGSNLKSATIGAKQETTATADASSYGGAIALNVSAAETELSHTGTTTANVKGNWDVAGDVNVTAENKETFDLDTDTASASIAGGSGGGLSKNVTQAAHVNLDGAHRYEPHARKQRHAHGEFLCHERRGRAPRRQPHGGRRARRHADEHHERDVQPHAHSFFHRPGHRCEARPGERRDGRRGLVRLLRRGYGHRGRQGRRDGAAFRAALHALRLRRRLHHCDGWRQGDGRRHDREQGRHRRHGHGRRA